MNGYFPPSNGGGAGDPRKPGRAASGPGDPGQRDEETGGTFHLNGDVSDWSPENGRNGAGALYPGAERGGEHATRAHRPARSADGEVDLREFLGMLRRNWWMVATCALLGLAAGWMVKQRQVSTFAATATVRVDDNRSGGTGSIGSMLTVNPGSDPVASQLQTLQSTRLLQQVARMEGLQFLPLPGSEGAPPLRSAGVPAEMVGDTLQVEFSPGAVRVTALRLGQEGRGLPEVEFALGPLDLLVGGPSAHRNAAYQIRTLEGTTLAMRGSLRTTMRPQTNVADIEFTSTDPALAVRVVNRLVEVFSEQAAEESRVEVTRRRAFLDERLGEMEEDLDQAQAALTDFRRGQRVVSSADQGSAEQAGLMNLELRREELLADRRVFTSLLAALEAPGGTGHSRLQAIVSLPELSGNAVIVGLYQRLEALTHEREGLTAGPWGLTDRNPDVVRIDQQAVTVRAQLEEALSSHLENLDARLVAMGELRDRTAGRVATRPEAQAEEDRLLAEVAGTRRTVDQLREQLFLARVAAAAHQGPVHVVDLAANSRRERQSGLPVLLALGFLLGGMVGSGGAVARELLNTTVRRADVLESDLRIPSLGLIPHLGESSLTGGVHRFRALVGRKGSSHRVEVGPGRELITLHDPRSGQAEAFRTLRTNLLFSPELRRVRSLVITSALSGEGKTTTASNLAVAYAQMGRRVLLVDCDLRKPRVDELFHLERKPGFTELVQGQVSRSHALQAVTDLENLHVLTAGALPPNPSELLGSPRAREVVKRLRDSFEVVILDTPPLSGGADAAILGAWADGVLMVVRAGSTEQEAARMAARQVQGVGGRLVGAVLNDPDGQVGRYGSYYSYQYAYYGDEG